MTKTNIILIAFSLCFVFSCVFGFLLNRMLRKNPVQNGIAVITETVSDTVYLRDTVRIADPKTVFVEVVRYDTVYLNRIVEVGDTVVVLPVTRRTFQTDDYRAVVEGYKPRLISIELYPKTTAITSIKTVTQTKNPRWALTAGAGIGYGCSGLTPHIGAAFGFVLWSN